MAMFLDDSSEDETCYLQLAERLRINRGESVPHHNSVMNEKDLKDLSNNQRRKHYEERSSSSSLDMVDWSAAGHQSVNGFKNKKRQNGDKSLDQLAKPKRTCLGNALQRSPNWIDRKASNSRMLNGPSSSSNSSSRNLYPDKTYEDHMKNLSDDSDFEPTTKISIRNRKHGLPGTSKTKSNAFQSSNKDSNLYENRPSGSHCVQFIDTTSDDDSENIINHGALKGGRQSPDTSSFKRANKSRIKKILESDESDKDDWQASYRTRPLIFSSSDSEDSRPSEKVFIKSSDKKPRKPAKLSSSSESLPEPRLNSYKLNGTTGSESFTNDRHFSIPSQSTSFKEHSSDLYRNGQRASTLPSSNISIHNDAGKNGISIPEPGESCFSGGAGISRSKTSRGTHHSNLARSAKRGNSHLRLNPTSNIEPHPSTSGSSTVQNFPCTAPHGTHHQLIHTEPPYQNVRRNHSRGQTRTSPRTSRGSGRIRSRHGKFDLAAKYPDIFDAEDSSGVGFFTANSYSDNESNTESLNSARMLHPLRSPGHPHHKLNISTAANDGSSEDEISVVFSSGPQPRSSEPRRALRTMGRMRGRGPRRRLPSVQNASFSPDPVEQVRQLEEDERFARVLQAQFDAEIDPTFIPHRHASPNPCFMNIGEEVTSESDDESSLDVHVDHNLWIPNRLPSSIHALQLLRHPVPRNFARRGRRRSLPDALNLQVNDITGLFHPFDDLFDLDSSDSYEAFAGLGDVPRGLQKTEIDRLPTRKFRMPNSASSSSHGAVLHKRSELNKECQVCLNDYINGDVLRILPCFHEFHTPCIDPWLKINHTCPVCRVVVDLGG